MTRSSENEKSRFLPSLNYVYIHKPKEIIEVEALPAGICTFYRSIFNEYKFDETFKRCTDLEISYRISRKYKLYQTPYAVGTHHHSEATHPNVRKLNKMYIIHTHKLVKKYLPHSMTNWFAYYWSIIGELILASLKSCVYLNSDYIFSTLDGIKHIVTDSSNNHNYK